MTALGASKAYVEKLYQQMIQRLTSHHNDPDAHGLAALEARVAALEAVKAQDERTIVLDDFLTDGPLLKTTNGLDWASDGARPLVSGQKVVSPTPDNPDASIGVYRVQSEQALASSTYVYRAQLRVAGITGAVRLTWGPIGQDGNIWTVDRSGTGYLSLSRAYVVQAENNLAPGSIEEIEITRTGNRVIVRLDGRTYIDHTTAHDDVRGNGVGLGVSGGASLAHYRVVEQVAS